MLIYILNLVLILALAWPLCIHKPTPKKKLCYLAVTFGALFLLVVDNISRNLLAVEIPLGILTAFVGAPFFLYLITRGGERA